MLARWWKIWGRDVLLGGANLVCAISAIGTSALAVWCMLVGRYETGFILVLVAVVFLLGNMRVARQDR